MTRAVFWAGLLLLLAPFFVSAQAISPSAEQQQYEQFLRSLISPSSVFTMPIPVQSTQAVDTLEALLQQSLSRYTSGVAGTTTNQALIETLLAQVAALQAQIDALIASGGATSTAAMPGLPTLPNTFTCPVISRALSVGMSGQDVTSLQQFLISTGHLQAGNATGYFGALTQTAVQAWQAAQGIVSSGTPEETGWGVVGPRTRVALENCTA